MSETLTLLRTLCYTPMRDVVCCRLTGRLNIGQRINLSELPLPIKQFIMNVVKRTRLWRLEKADLAEELTAHFEDALSAGRSPEDAIRAFGDVKQSAKLIARAKRRNRPFVWHLWRMFNWGLLALVLIYLASLCYFLAGKPSPSVDYFSLLNGEALASSQSDRAWPGYRKAILSMVRPFSEHDKYWYERLSAPPGTERWDELVNWLEAHQDSMQLCRVASQKPQLGFILGPDGSANDRELWPKHRLFFAAVDPQHRALIFVLLPYLNDLSTVASIVAADARLARHRRDAKRYVLDIEALFGMADQVQRQEFMSTTLVSLGFRHLALGELESMLTSSPDLLNDQQLRRLAHRLVGASVAADVVGIGAERLAFYDAVQQCFTDDGVGDGRLTPAGLRFLELASVYRATQLDVPNYLQAASAVSLVASRSETIGLFDQVMDSYESALNHPARKAFADDAAKTLIPLQHDLRCMFVSALMPSMSSTHCIAERYLGQRDGAEVAIALELYHRRHGRYPDSLRRLVPELMPQIPADRIDGKPLRYRLVRGQPVIYSVGVDRDDDGGRSPTGKFGPFEAAQWRIDQKEIPDGDWLLFPLSLKIAN